MRAVVGLIVIAGALVSGEAPGLAQGGATRNVRVLPKDWTSQQVQQFMRSTVAPGLGVMCSHCHVADRASDEKKEKVQARKMLQMLMAINDQHLKDVGDPTVAQKVTCYTCHRGTLKPLTGPPSGGS